MSACGSEGYSEGARAAGIAGSSDVAVIGAAERQVIWFPFRIARGDGFALRMAAFYAAFFAFGGIQMPYLPAWLSSRGLDAREIGILLAAPMVFASSPCPW